MSVAMDEIRKIQDTNARCYLAQMPEERQREWEKPIDFHVLKGINRLIFYAQYYLRNNPPPR